MRIPGTFKALCEQLATLPAPVRSVTIPTKNGPLVLEFAAVPPKVTQAPAKPEPRPIEQTARPTGPKIRDLALLKRMQDDPPGPFVYEDTNAAG